MTKQYKFFVAFLRHEKAYKAWLRNVKKIKRRQAELKKHGTMLNLLMASFIFKDTKEGHEYWLDLNNKFRRVVLSSGMCWTCRYRETRNDMRPCAICERQKKWRIDWNVFKSPKVPPTSV